MNISPSNETPLSQPPPPKKNQPSKKKYIYIYKNPNGFTKMFCIVLNEFLNAFNVL